MDAVSLSMSVVRWSFVACVQTAPSIICGSTGGVCRHSWPEAARVLQKAVEDSKKLKRRGTPNVVVFAGITLPQPFQFPILMSRGHVQFLHSLTEAFPPAVKAEGSPLPCKACPEVKERRHPRGLEWSISDMAIYRVF
jgi:hypothetical protein